MDALARHPWSELSRDDSWPERSELFGACRVSQEKQQRRREGDGHTRPEHPDPRAQPGAADMRSLIGGTHQLIRAGNVHTQY